MQTNNAPPTCMTVAASVCGANVLVGGMTKSIFGAKTKAYFSVFSGISRKGTARAGSYSLYQPYHSKHKD